jgi:glycosyltransferase involved in cell wall biosynthesis
MKKRVLMLAATSGIGGAGIALDRIINALKPTDLEVDLETLNFSSSGKSIYRRRVIARLNREYEKFFNRKVKSNTNEYISADWLPFNVLKKIDYSKYDLVHIHWINYGFMGLNHINRIPSDIQVVWTTHSFWPFSSPHQYFASINHKQSDSNFIIQKHLTKVMERVAVWITPSRGMIPYLPSELDFRVVNNPLPIQESKCSLNSTRTNFVFIGAGDIFDDRKGLIDLLELWISSEADLKLSNLIIVGPAWPATYRSVIANEAERRGVKFIGEVTNPRDLQSILRLSKAIFVPSHQETFGQVISESLAAGCPVIARDSIVSLGEFDSITEAIFKCKFTPESFKDAVDWVDKLDIKPEIISMKTQEIFSPDSIAKKLSDVYESLL